MFDIESKRGFHCLALIGIRWQCNKVKTITAINQKIGFRLSTKFNKKGTINIEKTIPLLGAVIGWCF